MTTLLVAPKIANRRIKSFLLFCFLLVFVIAVNSPVISFNMPYPEQPLIYIANQTIHSASELLAIYLHPKMLQHNIPFFRPSGHFLMYQLLVPLLGWHNTKGLIIVNLIFLALTGYLMLRLYSLLFPNYKLGGYLAFAVYLMHPALILSRLTILHFEFAHAFFVMLSVYLFMKFCANLDKTKSLSDLIYSLLFYMIAVSFKEPSVMLGPVLACYFLITIYKNQTFSEYAISLLNNKKTLQVLALLGLVSLALVLYLSLSWPSLMHPMKGGEGAAADQLLAIHYFLKFYFGWQSDSLWSPSWCNAYFSTVSKWIVRGLFLMSLISAALVFSQKIAAVKKSLVFLTFASILFLIIPILWAVGLPWHLNLSLIFLSLIMGFSCEYLCQSVIKNTEIASIFMGILSLVIGLMTVAVNQNSMSHIAKSDGFVLSLGRHAIDHPPDLSGKLNGESVIVVEDSLLHNPYWFGAVDYPYYNNFNTLNSAGFEINTRQYEQMSNAVFIKQQPVFNGALFKWAYLKPTLREEVYPFEVNHMEKIPNIILYNWAQHQGNIFCLGYDTKANWYDRSSDFKRNLFLETKKRHLLVKDYEKLSATLIEDKAMLAMKLPLPDYQLCQYTCDQNKKCQGFTYIDVSDKGHSAGQCLFYNAISQHARKPCEFCTGFLKKHQ